MQAIKTSSPNNSSTGAGRLYTLTDDLARLCLRRALKDADRKLAWTNSICALFLVVGLMGLKAPRMNSKPHRTTAESVPVVFAPPRETPRHAAAQAPEIPRPSAGQAIAAPEVVAVIAPAEAPDVISAVPVQGTVALAPMVSVNPPPTVFVRPPSAPEQFSPVASRDEGFYPAPSYPGIALKNRYQGTVIIEILVSPEGAISNAWVEQSSGFPVLDEAALGVVRKRWRFPAGIARHYTWGCMFRIQ